MEEPFYTSTKYQVADIFCALKGYDINMLRLISVDDVAEIVKRYWDDVMDSKLWDLYLVLYSRMDKENYISYEEFKHMNDVDRRPTKTIKKELEEIESMFKD